MIRKYKGTDIPDIISIWNKAMPKTPINRKYFVKNILLDLNFNEDGFFVAEENGEILGFVCAVIRRIPVDVGGSLDEDQGYINLFALKYEKDVCGGLGHKLIKCAEDYINSFGKRDIFVSRYTPNYICQGINVEYTEYVKLFESADYGVNTQNASIAIDLFKYSRPVEIDELKKKREEEGFIFTHLKDEYIPSLLRYWHPGWNHRFRRLLNETMDYEKFNLIIYNGEVVGCNVFGDPYSCEERFGPYGVNEEFRGRGLGQILIHDCLTEMKNRGLQRAWAQSTPITTSATHVYEKVGFVRTGEYIIFQKLQK